jgi:hypothetical protein
MKLATCHSNRKCQARGLCKSCYDKWLKANNPKYKADQAANTTKWLKIHPDKRIAIYLKRKAKIALDPETQRLKQRARGLKKKYGIAMADYDRMLEEQGGGCAFCFRKPAEGKYLHVDHCHVTGKVRGLLCHQCNWYLGTIEEDRQILARIVTYLDK